MPRLIGNTVMNWFERLMHNTGLMIHHVVKPIKKDSDKKVVSKTVEEEKVNDKVILRRTTIEEVEIKRDDEAKSQ